MNSSQFQRTLFKLGQTFLLFIVFVLTKLCLIQQVYLYIALFTSPDISCRSLAVYIERAMSSVCCVWIIMTSSHVYAGISSVSSWTPPLACLWSGQVWKSPKSSFGSGTWRLCILESMVGPSLHWVEFILVRPYCVTTED